MDIAIILQREGRTKEARAEIARLLSKRPQSTIRQYSATQVRRDQAEIDDDVAALRAAGLPD